MTTRSPETAVAPIELKMDVVEDSPTERRFAVMAHVPARFEFLILNGHVVFYGYRGVEADEDQEPDLVYDSDNDENQSLVVRQGDPSIMA